MRCFLEKLHSCKKIYTTAGCDGRDKFQLCSSETKKGQSSHQALVENWATDLLFQTTVPIGPTLVRVTWGANMDKVNMSQMPW